MELRPGARANERWAEAPAQASDEAEPATEARPTGAVEALAHNAATVEPEPASKAAVEPAKRTLKKVSKSEADKLARAYLDKQPWPGQNELARIINYWPQRMAELPAVQECRKEHPDVEPAHSPKAVGISEANEASICVGEPHGVLNAMIAKEEAEQELQRLAMEKVAMEKVTEIVKAAEEQAAEHRADFAPRKFMGKPVGRRRKA